MKISDYAIQVLCGRELEDKLLSSAIEFDEWRPFKTPQLPGRSKKLSFSNENLKFPKGRFDLDTNKAKALHSFANHELLAIELMALALLKFPHDTDEMKRFKLGIIKSLRDEQKHFLLYKKRLEEIKFDFGSMPLNDFFWRRLSSMKTPQEYLSVMALTFEAANLDFAKHFIGIFAEVDDKKTSNILDIVYKDEISHVAFGGHYLNLWKGDKTLWEYYQQSLPWPITPARSRGKYFDREGREKAMLGENFVTAIEKYQDDFRVTRRKEWE